MNVSVAVYDGAHHIPGTSASVRREWTWDVSYVNCRLEHREDGSVVDLATDDSLDTAEKLVASMPHCGKSVLTYGRHEKAYRLRMAELQTWVQRYLLQ